MMLRNVIYFCIEVLLAADALALGLKPFYLKL